MTSGPSSGNHPWRDRRHEAAAVAGRRWIGPGLVFALLSAGCAGSEPLATSPPRVAVENLDRESGSLVTVEGALVARPATAPRLCAALAESYPPQCVGASISVAALDVTRLVGTSTNDDAPADQRVVWTDGPISLTGRLDDGDLILVRDPVGERPTVLVMANSGPTCPVEHDPPDPACAPRPVAGATIELRAPGGAMATTVTDALGVAVFSVGAGDYDVVPLPVPGLLGQPSRQPITVSSGTTTVPITYDTGIR